LPANLIYTIGYEFTDPMYINFPQVITATAHVLGGPSLCIAYMAAFALLLRQPDWQRRLRPLGTAGRMALSNYLFQSLVCTTIFYSYGLGWYGSVGRTAGLGLVAIIYAAQIPLSVGWLKHFRFGPVEWIWRTLTYGKRQPMRV